MTVTHNPELKSTDVVVLDDEPEALKSIVDALEEFTISSGIRAFAREEDVWGFLDHHEVLARLHHQSLPRLIILDLNISGTKSFRTLQRLRKMAFTRHTPIVIFSDSCDHLDIQKCYEFGANAFVRKPVRFEAFDEAIQSIAHFWLDVNQI